MNANLAAAIAELKHAIAEVDAQLARLDELGRAWPARKLPDREPLLVLRAELVRVMRLARKRNADWRQIERRLAAVQREQARAVADFIHWSIRHDVPLSSILPASPWDD